MTQEYALELSNETMIIYYDDTDPEGTQWWGNGDIGGKCWVEGDRLIIGPTKIYHAACHYPDDHPKVIRERAEHAARAAAVPPWTLTTDVVSFLDLIETTEREHGAARDPVPCEFGDAPY